MKRCTRLHQVTPNAPGYTKCTRSAPGYTLLGCGCDYNQIAGTQMPTYADHADHVDYVDHADVSVAAGQ